MMTGRRSLTIMPADAGIIVWEECVFCWWFKYSPSRPWRRAATVFSGLLTLPTAAPSNMILTR